MPSSFVCLRKHPETGLDKTWLKFFTRTKPSIAISRYKFIAGSHGLPAQAKPPEKQEDFPARQAVKKREKRFQPTDYPPLFIDPICHGRPGVRLMAASQIFRGLLTGIGKKLDGRRTLLQPLLHGYAKTAVRVINQTSGPWIPANFVAHVPSWASGRSPNSQTCLRPAPGTRPLAP